MHVTEHSQAACRQTNDMYNVALMVGFEMLTGSRPDWYLWYARKFQMCQWTIASAPKHPALANVLETIMDVFATHTDDEVMKKGWDARTYLFRTLICIKGYGGDWTRHLV